MELTAGITFVILVFMKTAISITDDLFDLAENTAHQLGISRSKLFTQALIYYVDRHLKEKITGRLDDLYSKEKSSINRHLVEAQIRAISNDSTSW